MLTTNKSLLVLLTALLLLCGVDGGTAASADDDAPATGAPADQAASEGEESEGAGGDTAAPTTDDKETTDNAGESGTEDTGSGDEADSGSKEASGVEEDESEAAVEVVEPDPLTIGSPAPQLDIEHWIQDGKGQFAKVSEFESGKVYVVEFWATWCGPCIASMPHIAELQKGYADRGVQVVSITREDPETVESFLDREVRGAEEGDEVQTYRDLTSAYCLTADPDNSTSRDYMTAAKQNGIPCAFIVGKDTRVEWIGHPMSMDDPLEQIVTGDWDRAAFAAKFEAEQAVDELRMAISRAMRGGDVDEALAILDQSMEDPQFAAAMSDLRMLKLQVLGSQRDRGEEIAEVASSLLDDDSLDAMGVNSIAWTIYQLARTNRLEDESVIRQAIDASQKLVGDAGPQEPYLRDTIAHLHYELGDLEAALEQQQIAVDRAESGIKSRVSPFLEQLKKEIEEANAPAESPDDDSEKEGEAEQEEPAESGKADDAEGSDDA